MLEVLGYRVTVTRSGEEAEALPDDAPFHSW